jgi:hypothetical protein
MKDIIPELQQLIDHMKHDLQENPKVELQVRIPKWTRRLKDIIEESTRKCSTCGAPTDTGGCYLDPR